MLSESSQTEKGKFCIISFICGILKKSNSQKKIPDLLLPEVGEWGQGGGIAGRWSKVINF